MVGLYNTTGLTGKTYDAKLGMLDYGARWYDPTVGRFTQADTYAGQLDAPLSQHLYAYALDNPVNLIDPTGHDAESSGGDDSQYVFTYGPWYRKSVKYEDQTPPAPDDGLWTKVWVTTTEWARSYTKWDKTDYTPVESGEDPWHGEYRVEVDFEQVNGVWQQSGNVRVTGSLMPAGAEDPDSGPTREELEQQARDKADQIIKETVGQAPVPDGTAGAGTQTTSANSLSDHETQNLVVYVGNNRVNYVAPTGHAAVVAVPLVGGGGLLGGILSGLAPAGGAILGVGILLTPTHEYVYACENVAFACDGTTTVTPAASPSGPTVTGTPAAAPSAPTTMVTPVTSTGTPTTMTTPAAAPSAPMVVSTAYVPNESGYYGTPSSSSKVRNISGGEPAAREFFGQLSPGSTIVMDTPNITVAKTPEGQRIVFRPVSTSDGTPVVEIHGDGSLRPQKIHFVP